MEKPKQVRRVLEQIRDRLKSVVEVRLRDIDSKIDYLIELEKEKRDEGMPDWGKF